MRDFTFNRERNVYVCPTNKLLKTTGNVSADHKIRYRASRRDCRVRVIMILVTATSS